MSRFFLRKVFTDALKTASQRTEVSLDANNKELVRSNEASLTRRELLKKTSIVTQAAIGFGLLDLVGCDLPNVNSIIKGNSNPSELDIAIIGGGLAGLSSGYYLSGQKKLKIGLFEANPEQSRLGGRVFTQSNAFNLAGQKMYAELGGEHIEDDHSDLLELCKTFSLDPIRVRSVEDNQKRDIYFANGQFVSYEKIVEACRPLIVKVATDLKSIPEEILDRKSIADYLDGLGNVIDPWFKDLLTAAFTNFGGLDAHQQSSLTFLKTFPSAQQANVNILGPCVETLKIPGGNSALTRALAKHIQQAGIGINIGFKLLEIRAASSGRLNLTFEKDGLTKSITAQQIIIATPLPILKDIKGMANLELDPATRLAIAEMKMGTGAKQILGFNSKPWILPQHEDRSLLTRMFSDQHGRSYWDSSRGLAGEGGLLTGFLGGNLGLKANPNFEIEMLKTIEAFWPTSTKEFSGQKISKVWASDSYTKGSYSCLGVGQYLPFATSFQNPQHKGQVYFCGEHCGGDFAGYMNGAVWSAKKATSQILQFFQVQDVKLKK